MQWIATGFRRYFDIRGRSRRQEFWTWTLFTWLTSWGLGLIDKAFGLGLDGSDVVIGGGLLSGLFSIATLAPSLTVAVRRLHDTDRRGWWLLLPLAGLSLITVLVIAAGGAGGVLVTLSVVVLFFGGFAVLLVFFCLDGTRGHNRFGPDPKDPAGAVDLAEVFR